jgi:hypothetical protein
MSDVTESRDLYVDGEFVESTGNDRIEVDDPFTLG